MTGLTSASPARCRWGRGSRRRGRGRSARPRPPRRGAGPRVEESAPSPRRRSTSQRPGVHGCGSRPERRVTRSRAARRRRARRRSRRSSSRGRGRAGRVLVDRVPERGPGAASQGGLRLVALRREPNQTARTERRPSGIRSTACATARSWATTTPARPPRRPLRRPRCRARRAGPPRSCAQPRPDEPKRVERGASGLTTAPPARRRPPRARRACPSPAGAAPRPARAALSTSVPRAELPRRRLDEREQLVDVVQSRSPPRPAARGSRPRADRAGGGGAAQKAWSSAASAAERSTLVGWSAIRTSSVPKRGWGRASHQLRV